MVAWPARLGLTLAILTAPCHAWGQAAPADTPLVYGGDSEFPPYEYLDGNGRPQGFNIELVRALAREADLPVEIHLRHRDERMAEFDAGRSDVMFLSFTDARAQRYSLLDQTWTLAQVVMMRAGLPRYLRSIDDLWGYRIAVDEGSINHALLSSLPEARRPSLLIVATRADAIRAFATGDADGAAGNHLTMRVLMGRLADDAVEVPLISRTYHLSVLPGRETAVAPLRAALDRLKSTGEFDRLVEQYLTSPGRTSWFERYSAALGFGLGFVLLLVTGSMAWNRSLHQQVRARTKAVDRTERRYRDLVDNATDMIYRTDPFGRFTFVNPVAARLLGYTEAELLTMKYFELMRPDWVSGAVGFYENAGKSRDSSYLEFPVRRKDGTEIWVGQHVRPIVTSDQLEGFQGMARDITDRVSAQTELRSERDFVSAVLDTAPTLVMVLDAEGHIVRFNRACEALSGVMMGEVEGRPIWDMLFVLGEDRAAVRDGIARLAQAKEPVSLDRTWIDANGARRVIAWTVVALRDQDGATTHLAGIGSDVTVTRELDRLKSQFISMVSHELRTPLTSIRASLQLLVADAKPADAEADQLLRVALSNADRLIRIVNDILDMSKIEAGEMMVTASPTALGPIVDESVRSVEGMARNAGVRITVHAPVMPQVMADSDRTIQVIVNLLSNAVKHAPSGSIVDVTVDRQGPLAAVTVRDLGPGIPAHKLDFIFEPFRQLDGSDTRRIPGTGLGLTIARALAEKQGGGIQVASKEGEGAAFTVTLPVAPGESGD